MNKNQNKIDSQLVLEFQAGNKKALVPLVRRWHKIFCDKAFWLVKDADVSKDIAQDTWSTIISKITNLKDPDSFGSWALRIVYTKSLNWIKANKRTQHVFEDYKYEQDCLVIEENYFLDEKKKQLLETIKTLSKNQQVVIRLFYVEDYSLKEISNMLNISVGTAKSRLFHSRELLKKSLK